jgi:hypothetical protein
MSSITATAGLAAVHKSPSSRSQRAMPFGLWHLFVIGDLRFIPQEIEMMAVIYLVNFEKIKAEILYYTINWYAIL